MGFGDGVGSQIQRRISIWAYCKLNDIQYVHTPFFELEHNYEKDDKFENNWESFFNIRQNELSLEDVDSSHLSYTESMNKYFDENSPDLYDEVRDEFRKKYFMTENPLKIRVEFSRDSTLIFRGRSILLKQILDIPVNLPNAFCPSLNRQRSTM